MLYGVGNPLIDIIVRCPQDALAALGVVPGSMNLVDYEAQSRAIGTGTVVRQLPGGSCANTVRGVKWLLRATGSTAKVSYTGAIGNDTHGDAFEALLDTEGVEPILARKHTPTGSSAILVTPDSQRTMFTYLGACRDLESADIRRELIRTSRIVHLTGYMWDTPNQEHAAKELVSAARRSHTLVSLDVADPFVVERYRDTLVEWIPGHVNLLFANGEELRSLTQEDGDDAKVLAAASSFAETVVMKVGARGCLVLSHGRISECGPHPATRTDTTGAGDAFAAGYLFGLVHKESVEECARIANILASGIVAVDGCNFDALAPEEVRAAIQAKI